MSKTYCVECGEPGNTEAPCGFCSNNGDEAGSELRTREFAPRLNQAEPGFSAISLGAELDRIGAAIEEMSR